MGQDMWTWIFVVLTFGIYIGIAIWARAGSTNDFYVAGHDVHPVLNGMATGADWMSAASFISMAGIIAFAGYDGSVFLMGWTGGYVLLALLLAPYLREFGKFTVPDFVGDRYYSSAARLVAVICALFISFTYIAGQMNGVGIAFSRFLDTSFEIGIGVGMIIVFFYAVLGGMKGVTYTQVAQYCVLIFAYTVPAIFISLLITGNPMPQLGFVSNVKGEDVAMLTKLNQVVNDLGFPEYTAGSKTMFDVICITGALMVGTAGLPHVIIRFFTVPKASDARLSAGWALIFIAALYTVAPAVGAFARLNFIDNVDGSTYVAAQNYEEEAQAVEAQGQTPAPAWFGRWENTGLLGFVDACGVTNKSQAQAALSNPQTVETYFAGTDFVADVNADAANGLTGAAGAHLLSHPTCADLPGIAAPDGVIQYGPVGGVHYRGEDGNSGGHINEVDPLNRDIMVLANPEIANLPGWVVGLVVAGGLAAALSTAAGLLMVISSAISHDLCRRTLFKNMSDGTELKVARTAAAGAVVAAGLMGIYSSELAFVAEVVAFAFGLAAASLFPIIVLGIFWKRMNKEGAIASMVTGLVTTFSYIAYFKFGGGAQEDWLFGVSPEGIGFVFMFVSLAIGVTVSLLTQAPPKDIQDLVEDIRVPGTRQPHGIADQGMAPAE